MERMMTRPARGLPRAAALAAWLALSACSIGDLPLRSVLVELGYAWEQAARFEAELPAVDDQFGRCVALNGDWAAVGDNEDNSYRGAVYVYRKTNGIWAFSQKIAGASANDILGTSVAL